MLLDDQAALGFWSVEAHIDSQFAGNYSFEVVSGPLTVTVPKVPIPLTPAEVYRQAEISTVTVESLSSTGRPLRHGTGFFVASDRIATTFGVIDAAASVRITTSSGAILTSEQLVGWNRWQDWALIAIAPQQIAPLKPVSKPVEVGQECYSLGVAASGGRTISQETVVGDSHQPPAGPRLTLALAYNYAAAGGPVLDDFGNVIGMLGRNLFPGISSSTDWPSGTPIPPGTYPNTAFVVPISLITPSTDRPVAFNDLIGKGDFIPLLDQTKVLFGTLSTQLIKQGSTVSMPRSMEAQFSQADQQLYLMVQWNPGNGLKGMAVVRFYNLDNHFLQDSKPTKIAVSANSPGLPTLWTTPLSGFVPGMYRVDVYLGDTPVWREFFRVTP